MNCPSPGRGMVRFRTGGGGPIDPDEATPIMHPVRMELAPHARLGRRMHAATAIFVLLIFHIAMLVVGILTLLIWYVYPMLSSMKSMIQSMNELLNLSADIVEEPEKPEEEKPKAKKKTASPEPDESTSSVQGGAVNGFCLAGEWKGVRSCVGVPKGQACVSGQLFPTKEQCVNPTLR